MLSLLIIGFYQLCKRDQPTILTGRAMNKREEPVRNGVLDPAQLDIWDILGLIPRTIINWIPREYRQ